jgi:hypothetical protein
MIVKWVLVAFALAAGTLWVLGKVLAFLNPPRPGQPLPVARHRVNRALRWTVLLPAAAALFLLGLALLSSP